MCISFKKFSYPAIFITVIFTNLTLPQQIKFRHLDVEDGLSHSVVNCMIEDHFGFLWFGTDDGLNRYDGYSFRVFRNIPGDTNSISDNNIWSLFEDSNGNIWVGTQNGILNCFNPETERFKHFNLSINKISGNSITCIYRDRKGFLWIGSYKGGLYRLNVISGGLVNWQNNPDDIYSLSNKFVTSIYEDKDGKIWVGTYNGLCLLNKNSDSHSFTRFINDALNKNSLSDNIVWRILPSVNDSTRLWICTYNGLTYVDINKKQFTQIIPDKNNTNKFSRSISSVYEDFSGKDKLIWLGTYDGLLRLELNSGILLSKKEGNEKFTSFNRDKIKITRYIYNAGDPFSIINSHINNVLMDRSGVLWIAGQEGIDYYPKQKDKFNLSSQHRFEGVDFEQSGITNVQTICQTSDQTTWIGTADGIYALQSSGKKYKLLKRSDFSTQNIWSIYPGNNNDLWIGTYGNGLEHLELSTNKIKKWKGDWFDTSNIGNSYVRAVCQDKSGKVWIGMWGVGLNCLNPETGRIKRWHHEIDNNESLSYDDVWVIYEDSRQRLWIGTYGGGFNLFNPDKGGTFYKWLKERGNASGLSNNNILSVCESHYNSTDAKTVLWIGTTDGLNKFVIKNNFTKTGKPEVKFENFISQEKFISKTINSIEEDYRGYLWIGTNKGLIEYDPQKGILGNYTIYDGLKSNEFNPNAAFMTASGEIFIGNLNGINIFQPENISLSDYSPPVMLTDFQIFNRDVSIGNDAPLNSSIITAKEITLSYNQNVFSFQFSSLDYNAPEMNQYAYIMEGFDKDWILSGTRRFVTYTNLFPGTYTFKVKATNSDGVWNNSPAAISIIITPPFWATWWFRGLLFLILVGILYSVYRIRLAKMLELERLRIKIASDLHDDIGAALTRISLESELLNSNPDADGKREGLKRIGTMSRDIITSMSDIVWSIDSRNDTVEDLLNRMKDFSFSLFSLNNAQVQFETDSLNLQKKLKVDIRQNIYLIFKEALNNAAKYSGSDLITVSLKNSGGQFLMIITDRGSDFSPRKLTGHGLKNMQMRAEKIGGEIDFIKEDGLKIILTMKEL